MNDLEAFCPTTEMNILSSSRFLRYYRLSYLWGTVTCTEQCWSLHLPLKGQYPAQTRVDLLLLSDSTWDSRAPSTYIGQGEWPISSFRQITKGKLVLYFCPSTQREASSYCRRSCEITASTFWRSFHGKSPFHRAEKGALIDYSYLNKAHSDEKPVRTWLFPGSTNTTRIENTQTDWREKSSETCTGATGLLLQGKTALRESYELFLRLKRLSWTEDVRKRRLWYFTAIWIITDSAFRVIQSPCDSKLMIDSYHSFTTWLPKMDTRVGNTNGEVSYKCFVKPLQVRPSRAR